MRIVTRCFERLPPDLRAWIRNFPVRILDTHILRGEKDVRELKAYFDAGGEIVFKSDSGHN
jgi:hypothetical protein